MKWSANYRDESFLKWLQSLSKKHTSTARVEFLNWLATDRPQFSSHPLGFFQHKFYFGDVEYRVNVWIKNYQIAKEPNWPIHNHSYDFESLILIGSLIEVRYQSRSTKKNPTHKVYEVEYLPDGSRLTSENILVRLSKCAEENYVSGSTYTMKSNEFHEMVCGGDFALSLMTIGEKVNILPQVVTPLHENRKPEIYIQALVSPEILASKILQSGL